MNETSNYQNNPLHGVGLKQLVTEIVDYYGFDILFAYMNINCFKTNPSIDSSVTFLKKTEWAREKVESFYLYEYKSLPRATPEQFELPPRDRVIPQNQIPGEPAELSLEDAERLREKRARKYADRAQRSGRRSPYSNFKGGERASEKPLQTRGTSGASSGNVVDPWAKWRK